MCPRSGDFLYTRKLSLSTRGWSLGLRSLSWNCRLPRCETSIFFSFYMAAQNGQRSLHALQLLGRNTLVHMASLILSGSCFSPGSKGVGSLQLYAGGSPFPPSVLLSSPSCSQAHRPQATGSERAERIEIARLCFSCLPQWKGAYPTQPQETSSCLQGGVHSPSSPFSRSQYKNFSASLATRMLCKQPGNTPSLSGP